MTPDYPAQPISRALAASKTYAERSIIWAPAPPGETHFLGTLIVSQKKEKTVYRLDLTDADGMPGTATLLAKQLQLDRTGQPITAHEVYRVFVGLNPDHTSCNCTGFGRWRKCKHVDAVLALLTPDEPETAADQRDSFAGVMAAQPASVGACGRCDTRGVVFDADAGYVPCEACSRAAEPQKLED
jgi:hypothetical protein